MKWVEGRRFLLRCRLNRHVCAPGLVIGAVFLWGLWTAPNASGQENHATVRGIVTDADGNIAAGIQAVLQLVSCDCSSCEEEGACDCCPGLTVTVTGSTGFYTLSVPPGVYGLRATIPDYGSKRYPDLDLKPGVLEQNIQVVPD